MIAGLGAATFDERLARLDSGTAIERVGAVAMRPDHASGCLAGILAPYLR